MTGNNYINIVWSKFLKKHRLSSYKIGMIIGISQTTAKKYIKHPQFYFSVCQINILAGYTHVPIHSIFALINGIGRTQELKSYSERRESAENALNEIWTLPAIPDKDKEPELMPKRNNKHIIDNRHLHKHSWKVNTPPPDL